MIADHQHFERAVDNRSAWVRLLDAGAAPHFDSTRKARWLGGSSAIKRALSR
jgi:hypothetical protein